MPWSRGHADGEAELEQLLEQIDQAVYATEVDRPAEPWWVAWAQSPEDVYDQLAEWARLWWDLRGPLVRDVVRIAYGLIVGPQRLSPQVALQLAGRQLDLPAPQIGPRVSRSPAGVPARRPPPAVRRPPPVIRRPMGRFRPRFRR